MSTETWPDGRSKAGENQFIHTEVDGLLVSVGDDGTVKFWYFGEPITVFGAQLDQYEAGRVRARMQKRSLGKEVQR